MEKRKRGVKEEKLKKKGIKGRRRRKGRGRKRSEVKVLEVS